MSMCVRERETEERETESVCVFMCVFVCKVCVCERERHRGERDCDAKQTIESDRKNRTEKFANQRKIVFVADSLAH